jgi:hypothetical protein
MNCSIAHLINNDNIIGAYTPRVLLYSSLSSVCSASVDPLKCGGLTFTNSIDSRISGDFFSMNSQGSSGRVSHIWERGDEKWGAYYLKCDHPEGDTPW